MNEGASERASSNPLLARWKIIACFQGLYTLLLYATCTKRHVTALSLSPAREISFGTNADLNCEGENFNAHPIYTHLSEMFSNRFASAHAATTYEIDRKKAARTAAYLQAHVISWCTHASRYVFIAWKSLIKCNWTGLRACASDLGNYSGDMALLFDAMPSLVRSRDKLLR